MEHQAWILRSLLAQLEKRGADNNDTPNGIAGEFARLKSQSMKFRTDKTYPSKTAEKQENIKKNRYKDIVPFDHSRVKLSLTTAKNDTDYINGSFIKGISGSRAYIATQGPLPHTLLDFFRMLWEYNIQVIVMACREFEMGKKKCERYWPEKQEPPFVCETFTVHCDSEESKGDYLTRTLRVTYRNCSRTLKQLHYVNWPDHGVPDSIPPILEMLQEMRSYQSHDDIPICIHCSAGCGRTGALCVIDYTWNLLKKQMITPDFNIYDLVQNMRTQRPSLVQTKEQYELVYRTIRLLFERYLQLMDAQSSRNEVTMVPSPMSLDIDSELSDLSEEWDLQPQLQRLLDEEKDAFREYGDRLPSTSENLTCSRAMDTQRDQQELQLLSFYYTLSESMAFTEELQEGPKITPKLMDTSKGASPVEESTQEVPLKRSPSPTVAAAICMMVEDPYFDTPMSSPSSEEPPVVSAAEAKQWTVSPVFSTPSLCLNDQTAEFNSPTSGTVEVNTDEEAPPPLPQRTPESYVLAVDTEIPDLSERLIIPPNSAAEAVRELRGSSPSPVPPLPERTPESFELASDEAPGEQKIEVMPAVNLNRIGMSSEWFGNSKPAATASLNEPKPWARSMSLKANMNFTAASTHPDLASNTTSTFQPLYPPLDSLLLDQTEETPPLPDRTPESFILTTEQNDGKTALCPQPLKVKQPSPGVGLSSEWDGTAQPKRFLDAVMSRSKSVRAKSSKLEPLSTVEQLPPPPMVMAGGGSAQVGQSDVNHRPSLNTDTSGSKSDKSSEKGMLRTKSLKFFRHKQKPKSAPPPTPAQPGTPPPSFNASSTVFKFGFGNRFGKPKGPRSYPDTWV